MSHDFEPTDAEKEMLSYMKDIKVNQKQTELGEIISGAILDGQNQIHDLYKEKATSQQLEYRMRRAYIYWMDRLNKANDHQLQKAGKEVLNTFIEKQQLLLENNEGRDNFEFYSGYRTALLDIKHLMSKAYHSKLDQDKK